MAMTSTERVTDARSTAIADLFGALEGLLINYQAVPEAERNRRWSADADRITGEVARYLNAARVRIAHTIGTTDPVRPALAGTDEQN